MPDLYQLVYCSQNKIVDGPGASPALAGEIQAILAKSRANNRRVGVTGALLYSAGCFAQVLEGSLAAIEQTFERIQCDRRHGVVTVLRCGPISGRDFADWSMAYAGDAARPEERAYAALALGEAFATPGAAAGSKLLDLLRGVVRNEAVAA